MPQIRSRVTIKDVAKEAGVSAQTVSRVLNKRPDVASETRQRVLVVIDTLGYQPSALARSLIQRRSYTLGVVTAGLKYIGPSRTLNGIASMAEELGYALLLKELPHFRSNHIWPLLNSLQSRQVDGVLWAVPEISDNRSWLEQGLPENLPPVLFLTMEPRKGFSTVAFDNYSGGQMAVRHLLEQGCQQIAHLSGPLDWWEAYQRMQGWADALQNAHVPVESRMQAEGNWSSASGEEAFNLLLQSYPEMDAVFVANDQMALSVLSLACRRGIDVPDKLAVVGFDGIAESAYFWPPLTTVSQDHFSFGRKAVEELVRIIEAGHSEGGVVEPHHVLLFPELVVRESSTRRSGKLAQ